MSERHNLPGLTLPLKASHAKDYSLSPLNRKPRYTLSGAFWCRTDQETRQSYLSKNVTFEETSRLDKGKVADKYNAAVSQNSNLRPEHLGEVVMTGILPSIHATIPLGFRL